MYDVVIIGAGVIGLTIARELSKYSLRICVLEKENDVGLGASKANSGLLYNCLEYQSDSLKMRLGIAGNKMYDALCSELDVPLDRKGSILLLNNETELQHYLTMARDNGVEATPVSKAWLAKNEPELKWQGYALHFPNTGVICPNRLTIALGENLVANGVEIKLETAVTGIELQGHFTLHTTQGTIATRYLVNAAGNAAAAIMRLAGAEEYRIVNYKGEFAFFDRTEATRQIILQAKAEAGTGLRINPTADGYLLISRTAVSASTDLTTTGNLDKIIADAAALVAFDQTKLVGSFAGVVKGTPEDDFYIKPSARVPGLINVAGIDAPGLTAAPAIGRYVVALLNELGLMLTARAEYRPQRKAIVKAFVEISEKIKEGKAVITTADEIMGLFEGREQEPEDVDAVTTATFSSGGWDAWEHQQMIKRDPRYGNVVCQCEEITESEIIQAIHRPLGAKTMEGLKRRTRACGGKCQGAFCMPKVARILARELGVPLTDVVKSDAASPLVVKPTKAGLAQEGKQS